MAIQKRARDPKAKEMRRESILQAASLLYALTPQQLPTISAIATKAGVAKGTVYLYFKSKEEIFLALLEDHYLTWLKQLEVSMTGKGLSLDKLVDTVCDYVLANPEFMHLAVISNSIIEQNIERAELMAYKNHISSQFKKTAQSLSQLTQRESAECVQFLMHSYAMLIGLWQLSNPSAKIAEALSNPALQMFKPDFATEAKRSLQSLWQGFLAEQKEQKKPSWRSIFS